MQTDAWARGLGLFTVLVGLLVCVNQGLFAAGLPAFSGPGRTAYNAWGQGMTLPLTIYALVVVVVLHVRASLPASVWPVAGAVFVLFASCGATGTILGLGVGSAFFWAVVSVAYLLSAVVVGPVWLGPIVIWGGGAFAWLNVAVGLMASTTGLNRADILNADSRYGGWMSSLGWPSQSPGVEALIGIGNGRQVLGVTCAIMIVAQIILLRSMRPRRALPWLVGPLGTGIALAWSMSRTGLVAALIGLAAAYLPWQRISRNIAQVGLFAGSLFLLLLPLGSVFGYQAGSPRGTWQWRLEVWHGTLESLSRSPVIGIGSATPLPMGATHSHNVFLEVWALGGVLGVLALVTLLWLASKTAVAAARTGQRALVGILVVYITASQTEMPINLRDNVLLPQWLLLLLVLGTTLALSSAPQRVPASTRDVTPPIASRTA